MKIAVYNCTYNPEISNLIHFGCELVKETIAQQLTRVGHEFYFIPWQHCVKNTYKISDDTNLVLVNGEGSWHNNKRDDMLRVAEKYPSIMFNTVYQNNSYNKKSLDNFIAIYARESMSVELIENDSGKAKMMPDIILSNENITKFSKNLNEKIGHIDHRSGIKTLQKYDSFLSQIQKYSHIASGSFHGALVCSMLDIPFSLWPSNTHKMIALAKDMNIEEHHHLNKRCAINSIPHTLSDSVKKYVNDGKESIDHFFNSLENYV